MSKIGDGVAAICRRVELERIASAATGEHIVAAATDENVVLVMSRHPPSAFVNVKQLALGAD